jgi:plasmid stabilization system protein ParE
MTDEEREIVPLALSYTAKAESHWLSLVEWLREQSDDAAKRFADRLDSTVDDLRRVYAAQIAAGETPSPIPDEGASLQFSRPVYQERFRTSKTRRRRSSAGEYRIFYILLDENKDGKIDTLRVYAIRHAAARPYPHFEED